MADRPKRVFTLEEARRLVPELRERTRRAVEALARLPLETGEETDVDALDDDVRSAAEDVFRDWAKDVSALGIEVKGPWLVDFDSGGGYYCWKWPEESLDFFHGYSEGFAGRVRLQ